MSSTLKDQKPSAVCSRVMGKVKSGELKLWQGTEEALEQFLGLKLVEPGLSDEAAASLVVAAQLVMGLDVEVMGGDQ